MNCCLSSTVKLSFINILCPGARTELPENTEDALIKKSKLGVLMDLAKEKMVIVTSTQYEELRAKLCHQLRCPTTTD